MSGSRWIKLDGEQITQDWKWRNPAYLKLWLYLLVSVNWEDDRPEVGLKRGQMSITESQMAEESGLTRNQVAKFLRLAEESGDVKRLKIKPKKRSKKGRVKTGYIVGQDQVKTKSRPSEDQVKTRMRHGLRALSVPAYDDFQTGQDQVKTKSRPSEDQPKTRMAQNEDPAGVAKTDDSATSAAPTNAATPPLLYPGFCIKKEEKIKNKNKSKNEEPKTQNIGGGLCINSVRGTVPNQAPKDDLLSLDLHAARAIATHWGQKYREVFRQSYIPQSINISGEITKLAEALNAVEGDADRLKRYIDLFMSDDDAWVAEPGRRTIPVFCSRLGRYADMTAQQEREPKRPTWDVPATPLPDYALEIEEFEQNQLERKGDQHDAAPGRNE